jgi:DNA-binding winged helix-turn-helix (wHTH) protein
MQSCFALVIDSYLILRRKADVELEYELLKCLKLLLNHEVQH